jgi:hypothetical protein
MTIHRMIRRPSAGWGPSRLSTKRCASRLGGIGPSLRWGGVVLGGEAIHNFSASPRLRVNQK